MENIQYIDIGVNLFSRQFKGNEDNIVHDSYDNNVGMIITGTSAQSSISASKYVKDKDNIWATAGVHPHAASTFDNNTFGLLEIMLKTNKNIVAVGECGLDYDRMFSPKDAQLDCFEKQIVLAEMSGKPLFLHERSAFDDFYMMLRKHKNICTRSVVHCFTGNKEEAMRYLNLGCYIGVTGWVCDDRRNKNLLEALKYIPVDRIMIETDSPYLIPGSLRGKSRINVPQNIKYVCARLADIKKEDEEVLREKLLLNTKQFFNLDID